MKKLILLSAISFLTLPALKAQNTTQDEYNWMVNGYKLMVSTGGEMKKGYYFSPTDEFTDSWTGYKITYKVMKREFDQSLAGFLIILAQDTKVPIYFCMPAMSTVDKKSFSFPALSTDFYQAVWALDETSKNLFVASLSRYLMMASTKMITNK